MLSSYFFNWPAKLFLERASWRCQIKKTPTQFNFKHEVDKKLNCDFFIVNSSIFFNFILILFLPVNRDIIRPAKLTKSH